MFMRGTARDNEVTQSHGTHGYGIRGNGSTTSICRDNDVQGYLDGLGVVNCAASGNTLQ